jgi:hypothetical protein
MANDTLRQAFNQVKIEGLLSEKNLEEVNVHRGDGTDDAIRGSLSIETTPNSVHQVRLFTFKHKKDGGENKVFNSLKTVMDEYKAIADDGIGRENADKVRVTRGQLGINDYVGQDGALRSFPQISTNFVNRVTESDKTPYEPKATFDVEGFVKAIRHETKDEEETGRIFVTVVIPEFGAKVAPIEFVVNEDLAGDFEDLYSVGTSGEFQGDVVNYSEAVETLEKGGIGKPKKKITYNVKRELVITWASEPFEDDNAKFYNTDTIKKALLERDTYLEGLKGSSSNNSKSTKSSGGIGSKPSESASADDDLDLPF